MNTKKYIISIILAIALTAFVTSLYFLKLFNPSIQVPTPSLVENIPDKPVVFPQPTNNNAPITKAPVGTAVLFGDVNSFSQVGNKQNAEIQLIELVQGQDNQEQSALVDGTCTLDQIEKDACLNNLFYIRQTNKILNLTVSNGVDIEAYAREPRGGMLVTPEGNIYMEKVSLQKFISGFNQGTYSKQTLFHFIISDGIVTSMKEQLTP